MQRLGGAGGRAGGGGRGPLAGAAGANGPEGGNAATRRSSAARRSSFRTRSSATVGSSPVRRRSWASPARPCGRRSAGAGSPARAREGCYPRRAVARRGHGAGRNRRAAVGTGPACAGWRAAGGCCSVVLLSFSSGLPLGIVWFAIPAWMARVGVDIKVIGLFTLAQAPWSFKLLWSPWMDRFPPPFLGRKRGWILIGQVALFAVTLWLAGVSSHPEAVWVIGALALAIAFASATQDIAIDAYAVEVLRREEQGFASGARTAFYRAAMLVAGGRRHHPGRGDVLDVREPAAGPALPALHGRHRAGARARVAARAPADAPGGRVGALRGLPRAAPLARDPRLRRALQARATT